MLTSKYPVTTSHSLPAKCGRKPLQPRNHLANANSADTTTKTKPKQSQIDTVLTPISYANKENHPIYVIPTNIESVDSSLAQELSAIRKKLERLRLDKEKTENMLRDRDLILDTRMTELQQRGEFQKQLEIEVDRLYRLNELKSFCMRISPIRSLRDREEEKNVRKAENYGESVGESSSQS